MLYLVVVTSFAINMNEEPHVPLPMHFCSGYIRSSTYKTRFKWGVESTAWVQEYSLQEGYIPEEISG